MPTTSTATKTSTPRLSEQAKHLSVPTGVVSSGWPAVRRTCVDKLGVTFDPWQDAAGRLVLAKREDGTLAVMIDGVGMSLPRQVGKTHLISAIVFALCVNMPGLLVIWTAHHMATSSETFLAIQGFAGRVKVAPHIDKVYTGSGDEEVRFHNGSRILFGARERGFGRGIPGVDVLIFDEAQILSDKAMSNMLATMNTSKFGLQFYIGTPPKPEDMSETFKRMRREALAGTLEDGAWIEFGADADAADDDRKQWRKMNPSYPSRTPSQSLMRLKRKLTHADWRREGMGIWDDDNAGSRAISDEQWIATGVDSPPDGLRSFGVAFSADGTRLALAGAIAHGDDEAHVELLDASSDHGGLAPLADWFCAKDPEGVPRWRKAGLIVIGGSAGAGVLKQLLVERKVSEKRIRIVTTPQYLQACVMFSDAIEAKTATHLKSDGQLVLDEAIAFVDRDKRGGWMSTVPEGDETPVEAVSLALWGARTNKRKPAGSTERKAVFL